MHRTGKNAPPPPPMNTMLMKESKEEAVQKMSQQSKMVVGGNTNLICLYVRLVLCMFAHKIDNIVQNLLYNRLHSWYF